MSLSTLPRSRRTRQRRCFRPGWLCTLAVGLFMSCGALGADESLMWFDGGRPNKPARQAVVILEAAAQEGLDAGRYNADALSRVLDAADQGPALPDDTLARLDYAMSEAMQRYLADLHFGQIDPRAIQENFTASVSDSFEPSAYVRAAVADDRLGEAVSQAAPALPQYARLRQALVFYRALAGDPAMAALWQTPLPVPPGGKLNPRQAYAGLHVLIQRLQALGDLPGDDPSMPARYEGAAVDGVKAFQRRHGLAPDGVIGQASFEQLNVPPAARVRQIEMAMERLRWTPLTLAPRMVVVNVPEFKLRAYEVRDGKVEELAEMKAEMKVIVGKALDTRTPLFDEEMRFIEFSPYWNVPPSIARAETVPKLRRDPGYFARQGFEFVSGDGRRVTTLSSASLDAVARGQLRIRQRPGRANALGDIKFVFPNKDNIYLHHTPTPRLFQKDRRDFSHGCIRVEEPVALAKFVLQSEPEWDEARIRAAMTKGASSTLRLWENVRVVIAYNTVTVSDDGRVHFFPDIYGQDKLLDAALRPSVQDGRSTLALKK